VDASLWGDNLPIHVAEETDEAAGQVRTPYGAVHFLSTTGTYAEMGADIGRRTREAIHEGCVPFFASYLAKVLKNSPVARFAQTLDYATLRLIGQQLWGQVPWDFRDAIEAMTKTADLSERQVLRAYLMPETFVWILATYHRVLGTRGINALGAPPSFGCTSAITVPPHGSTVLHGRNFDYFGIGTWDEQQTVTFYAPSDGIPFVAIASAGILGAGATAMNAAGLTLVIHQHFPEKLDLTGVPVGIGADAAIRRAKTIEEAVAILRTYPPVAGWTYIMTEGDSGRAAIYEDAPGKENLQWIDPDDARLGYANVYWGENMDGVELDFFAEYHRCNFARQDRVGDCLMELAPNAKPVDIARILGDDLDPVTERRRLVGSNIVSVVTVASVVFEPEHRRVWVGVGKSPTCRGWFVPFRLNDDGTGGPDLDATPFHPFPGWQESDEGQAYDYYRRAAKGANDGMSDEQILIYLEHALALHPGDPNLRVLAGLVALKINRARRAEGAFRRALESLDRADRRAEVGLYLAWALDLGGQRISAKHLYRTTARDPNCDPMSRTRARLGQVRRFAERHARALTVDFTYASVP
jgi:hypothetical protein